MDYTDEVPERWWVLDPSSHSDLVHCSRCQALLNRKETIPRTQVGPLCDFCSVDFIKGKTPVTATYLNWLETGDPRWWSSYLCNCEGCDVESLSGTA